jgi:hypothetical protein
MGGRPAISLFTPRDARQRLRKTNRARAARVPDEVTK